MPSLWLCMLLQNSTRAGTSAAPTPLAETPLVPAGAGAWVATGSMIGEGGRRMPVNRLVICAGAWSGRLSRQLGDPFPIEADRGYNTTLPAP